MVEWIKFADAKAAVILTAGGLVGATFGVSIAYLAKAARVATQAWFAVPAVILGSLAALTATGAAISAIRALNPRLDDAEESLLSFPDVAKMESKTMGDLLIKMDDSQMVSHYARHSVALAKICKAKFQHLQTAWRWMYGLVVTSVLTVGSYWFALLLGEV